MLPPFRRASCALTLLSLCSGTPAFADQVSGLRSEELAERKHAIALKMFRTHAELTVRRTVHNGGPRHDQATFYIDVPAGAVAVGLRTLGALGGRPHWFSGELLEAEAAAAKYRELTGIGGYYPKDPALLSWRTQELLALQVFPCAPAQDKTIEYTLNLPTHYEGGAFHVSLPPLGSETLAAELEARPADRRDQLLLNGERLPGARVAAERWRQEIDLALVPHDAPTVGGELVTVPFADGRVLTRYSLQAAPKLSSIPRGAHVVALLDASLSTYAEFMDDARAALDAYLAHFEGTDAKVEILTFDRRVVRRLGAFRPLAEARHALAGLQLTRHNGSDVDAALAEADSLLYAAPAGAARRIVLLTDGLTRSELTPERLRAALARSGAVTHAGLLESGEPALERLDEHPWASGLRPSGGLVWRAQASTDAERAALGAVFEEWARPLRIDHLSVYSPEQSLREELEQLPEMLAEGQGFSYLGIETGAAPWLALQGELWTTPVRATFGSDPGQQKLWSGLVFGSPTLDELNEDEMMTLALRGRAVSPVTSYLAIEPGVRPSTEGLEETGQGFGLGLSGVGEGGGGSGQGGRSSFDRQAFLKKALGDAWRSCGGRPGAARVSLQTTSAEIVAIDAVRISADRTPHLERCLTDAVWDLVLPLEFDEDWSVWNVEV